jgi:hypothetical protein
MFRETFETFSGTSYATGVQELLQEFLDPYRRFFDIQGATDGFLALIEFLDCWGECPSVVKERRKDEDFYGAGIFENISLREHTINVARNMVKLLKETYRDYEYFIPKTLTASFGHDLGKIPELRESDIYARADHPVISAQKVAEIFFGKEPHWLRSALEAIRDHHRTPRDSIPLLLKKADKLARQEEMISNNPELRAPPLKKWLDVERILQIIAPEIDTLQLGNRWKALSFGSMVYVQPNALYETTRKLASEKKIVDISLLRGSDVEEVVKKVVDKLREEGMLGNDVKEGYRGRVYEIRATKFRRKMLLVPVKIEAFGLPSKVIKRRKPGYLGMIEEVIPWYEVRRDTREDGLYPAFSGGSMP